MHSTFHETHKNAMKGMRARAIIHSNHPKWRHLMQNYMAISILSVRISLWKFKLRSCRTLLCISRRKPMGSCDNDFHTCFQIFETPPPRREESTYFLYLQLASFSRTPLFTLRGRHYCMSSMCNLLASSTSHLNLGVLNLKYFQLA